MGHDVEVALITRNGKTLFVSDTVNSYAKSHFEGQIFEVMLRTRLGLPYFAYYTCLDYYVSVATNDAKAFGGNAKTEEFRTAVSNEIAVFTAKQLKASHGIDAAREIASFSHNRAHTNVLAYVSSLGEWCAIQHNDDEGDDATATKVVQVNAGRSTKAQVTAVMRPSPTRGVTPQPADEVKSEGEAIALVMKYGTKDGGARVRKLADEGNIYCQIFMYQSGLSLPVDERPAHVVESMERYALMAATGGDATAQYNYAKLIFNKVDTSGDWISQESLDFVTEAKRWHLAAAKQGLPEARESYDRIHSAFPDQ